MNAQHDGPLAGVRVIDLTIWMAGPIASMLLADLGADVIKIEGANGDPSRASRGAAGDLRPGTPLSLAWTTCNRNKRALSLDLGDDASRPVFHRLIESADVFLTNLHLQTLKKLRADEESVRAVNPNLIYARAAGLGDRGPRANDHCQDMTGMAYAGLLFTYSSRDDVPFAPPGAMNDVLTGTMVAFGTLAAILERQRSGKGQVVSGSLVQTSLWAQLLNFGTVANTTQRMVAYDRDRPRNALVNQYRCADGRWIAVAGILPRYWPLFCEAIGAQHLMADERFSNFDAMVSNSVELVPLLDAHFATAPSAHWLERMLARGLWAGPVNHLEELMDDPQIVANEYLTTLDDGTRTVAMPFTLHGYRPGSRPGPALDADSDAVLRDLEVSQPARSS